MIARKMLEFQLQRLGVFNTEETISSDPNFDKIFKILWANYGDDISIQYSGILALKGDFVRCGQRTVQGIHNDGYNALMRYYLNNFADGTKQLRCFLLCRGLKCCRPAFTTLGHRLLIIAKGDIELLP